MQDENDNIWEPRRPVAEAVPRLRAGLGDLWWWFLARGLLALLLGLCLLLWPGRSVALLAVLLGFFLLLDGVAGLVGAMRARQTRAGLPPALISLVVGGVLLLWPGATLRVLLIVTGIWALFSGLGYVMAEREAARSGAGDGHLKVIGITIIVVGLVLIFWPITGIVTVAWVLAAAAFAIAAVLLLVASRLRRIRTRLESRS